MQINNIDKWQEEIEVILREQFQGDELSEKIKMAYELIDLIQTVEVPTGVLAPMLAKLLKSSSENLRPLAAVYAGFQLGMAYERYQNAN